MFKVKPVSISSFASTFDNVQTPELWQPLLHMGATSEVG
jgi:hypothetical protein